MGIAKKGTRPICVDGVLYRWVARQLSPGVRIVAQAAEGSGAMLVLHTDQDYGLSWVMPADVSRAIQAATILGWEPRRAGPPFEVAVLLPLLASDIGPNQALQQTAGAFVVRDRSSACPRRC